MTASPGPVRWWLPLGQVDPASIRVEALHAALGWWLERPEQHRDQTKPYALSPVTVHEGQVGLEVVTLSVAAAERFASRAVAGAGVRLDGAAITLPDSARPLAHEPWATLATPSGARSWDVELRTPTTVRTGQRFSPMLRPESFLRRLSTVWETYSGAAPRRIDRTEYHEIWISHIEGETVRMRLRIGARGRSGRPTPVTVSGFVGRLEIRCDARPVADRLDALLRLSSWCGIGALTEKGLGVVAVTPSEPPRAAASARSRVVAGG